MRLIPNFLRRVLTPAPSFIRWFEARLIEDPDARTPHSWLYADYSGWMLDRGGAPLDDLAFRRLLAARKVFTLGLSDDQGRRLRVGVRLKGSGLAADPVRAAPSPMVQWMPPRNHRTAWSGRTRRAL